MTMSSTTPASSALTTVSAALQDLDGHVIERSVYDALQAEYTTLLNDVQRSLLVLATFMPQKRMRVYRATLTDLSQRIGVPPPHIEFRNHRSHERRERQDLRDTLYMINADG